MATHFPPLSKMFFAHLHFKANICAKFHLKCISPHNFWHTCRPMSLYRGNKFSATVVNGSCTSTPQGQHVYQISYELLLKCFVFRFLIICRYHGNAHSTTVQKCVMHIHLKVNMCAKFNLKMFFPTMYGIICRYHGNALSATVEK